MKKHGTSSGVPADDIDGDSRQPVQVMTWERMSMCPDREEVTSYPNVLVATHGQVVTWPY